MLKSWTIIDFRSGGKGILTLLVINKVACCHMQMIMRRQFLRFDTLPLSVSLPIAFSTSTYLTLLVLDQAPTPSVILRRQFLTLPFLISVSSGIEPLKLIDQTKIL
jgi:hypothetical protein